MQSVLIVDDNDRYANNLKLYFEKLNINSERAINAKEGYDLFLLKEYTAIISDITMETQISGLLLVRKIYKSGYKGKIIIATTGFDVSGVMFFSQFILPIYAGVGWMIPKVPLKKGEVLFYPTKLTNSVNPFN